ncbi:MAG TPA: hypothetical protein VHG32_15560 [Thermoanaerobaculia bacterium]|nr:hypothetical protein [Thermoanaerobaculia bacterium]
MSALVAVACEPDCWQWHAAEGRVEEHLDRRSLYLKGGIATVAGARLTDGWIEFDIAFARERGFVGGVWRVQDPGNYEEFYLRPHQSGNPDATQYTPVFHGLLSWQLYHGPRYTVPIAHRFDEWIRVRIAFAGLRAEIYVDDMARPALAIDELKRGVAPGGVGVAALDFAPAWFSNFSYGESAESDAPLPARRQPEPVPDGVIASWQVSDAFAESVLEGKTSLGAADLAGRRWTRLATERSGLANLARIQGVRLRGNTVLARAVIVADRDRVARLDLGFSDRVRVYLNGRLLFWGDDTFQSRDYRFLGSIGYFDALYLPLTPGANELLLAVSEDQGGWGLQAKLESLPGLSVEEAEAEQAPRGSR